MHILYVLSTVLYLYRLVILPLIKYPLYLFYQVNEGQVKKTSFNVASPLWYVFRCPGGDLASTAASQRCPQQPRQLAVLPTVSGELLGLTNI